MNIELRWRRELHQRTSSRAIVQQGVILSPERSTKLARCCPETGGTLWEAHVGNTFGWPAVDQGRCFWLEQHSELIAFNLNTGIRCWSCHLDGVVGLVTVSGPTVLVGGWRGYTRPTGVAVATGEQVFRLQTAGPVGKPLSVEQGFLLPLQDEAVLVDHSGQIVDRIQLPHGYEPSDGVADIIAVGDALWSATRDGHLWIREAGSGAWRIVYRHRHEVVPSSVRIAPPVITFRDRAGEFWWFNPITHQAEGHPEMAPDRGVASILQVEDGLVLATHPNNGVQLVNRDGESVAALQLDKMIVTPLARATAGTFVVGTSSAVVALAVTRD